MRIAMAVCKIVPLRLRGYPCLISLNNITVTRHTENTNSGRTRAADSGENGRVASLGESWLLVCRYERVGCRSRTDSDTDRRQGVEGGVPGRAKRPNFIC